MRSHKVLVTGAALLALGLVFLSGGQAADQKDLKAELDKLVKTAADKPDDVQKAGAAFAKENKIDNDSIKKVMDYLGRRDVKDKEAVGWGVGKEPGEIKPDGIELKLRDMFKTKPMTAKQLAKEKDALIEMANRTAAIGSISLASAPPKPLPGKDPKEWKKWSEEMIKTSKDFADAVKGGNPAAVKDAVSKLNGTCVECHSSFRGE